MKWLPFKLTEQEKQALKEAGKGSSFQSFQIKAIVFAILIIAAIVLLWRHYQLLSLLIVVEGCVFAAMYTRILQGLKMPASLREKIGTEIERQEKEKANALKFRPKIFLFVVLPLILLLFGIVVYILYSTHQEREEMIFGFDALPLSEEKTNAPTIFGLPEEIRSNKTFLEMLGRYQGQEFSFSENSKTDLNEALSDFRAQVDIRDISQKEFLYEERSTFLSFSPDRKRAIYSVGCDYCDPDSTIWLFNRKLDGFSEVLARCGSACHRATAFWLDNDRAVYVIDISGDNPGEMRSLLVSLLDFNSNEKITYLSKPVSLAESTLADWQTYRNEEYGFEVKYPDGWTVNQEWWGSAIKSFVFYFKSPRGDRGIYIQIQTNMFEEYWRGSYDIITEKELVIGGIIGSKIVGALKSTNRQEIFALVKKEEDFYHIHFPLFYQDEEFLDIMLSTFRFLEE